MVMVGEDFRQRNEDSDSFRKRYAEEKLQEQARRAGAAASDCEQLLTYLRRLGASGPGSKVLDLGCGTGRLTIELAERGYDIYGVDINGDVINIARNKTREKNVSAHFTVALAEFLPFSNGIFDICIADSVLEHVNDWKRTIGEVVRVLKPGGIAYFDAANALCPFPTEVKYIPFFGYFPGRMRQWMTNIIVARFPSLVDYSLTPARNWFTPTGLRKALSQVGFKQSWDLFDAVTKEEIPQRYRFARPLLPLLKKTPKLYIRDIAHFPLAAVRLFCQKD
jgi:2-polyprenyl-6-hydroxyphenyl methylase/3-demethylubiquinone-9 3-methyltransferase